MEQIGAYEAKTYMSQLLERVAGGERFTITKRGVPIAVLLPAEAENKRPVEETIQELKTFRREHRLEGLSVRALIEEGRC